MPPGLLSRSGDVLESVRSQQPAARRPDIARHHRLALENASSHLGVLCLRNSSTRDVCHEFLGLVFDCQRSVRQGINSDLVAWIAVALLILAALMLLEGLAALFRRDEPETPAIVPAVP